MRQPGDETGRSERHLGSVSRWWMPGPRRNPFFLLRDFGQSLGGSIAHQAVLVIHRARENFLRVGIANLSERPRNRGANTGLLLLHEAHLLIDWPRDNRDAFRVRRRRFVVGTHGCL